MSFIDEAKGNIIVAQEQLSLHTLQPEEVKKIMSAFERGKQSANQHYTSTIEPAILKRQNVYNASENFYKKKFPILSELTDWVSRDVKTTIDWMLPSILEAFTGTDDPCDITGVNVEDDDVAEKIQNIIKYQIQKKNDSFMFLYKFIREGLITNEGIAKIYWKRDEDREEMEVMVDEATIAEYIQMAVMGQIEIKSIEPISDGTMAKMVFDKIEVKANHPVLENMSPSELRFTPEGRTIHESKFVAHRKIVKGDYLKRKEREGVYVNVDMAISNGGGNTTRSQLDTVNNEAYSQMIKSNLSDSDNASKDVELYEAYLKVDYNNDGIYENVIVHAVGKTPLAIQENTFDMPPFFIFSPEVDSYNVFGKNSYADTLEQLQDLKTALIRQAIIATGKNNRPQKFVRGDMVDMDALINGEEIVPVDENPINVIMTAPQISLSPYTMNLIEYAQNEIESQSGSTKYNQGLDSSSLNRTATGINAIMGAADKKMRMVARIFAETSWLPIVRFIILLNQKFLDPIQQFRINNQMIDISNNDFNIDYDLTVNVGQGAGTKETQMNYLVMLMQQLYPKLEQVGIVNADSWYEATKDLLEKMGIRNTQSYIIDPNSQMGQQISQQKAESAQQQMQMQIQAQQAIAEAKNHPKLSVNYRDLPTDAKASILNNYGVQATPQTVARKEILDKV